MRNNRMKDVFFEWSIPYVPDRRRQLLKALMTAGALVCFYESIFFAGELLAVSLLLAVGGFFLFRSWRYEYEFSYTNGQLDVAKIIRKEKRRELYRVDRPDMESFQAGRTAVPGVPVKDFTSGRPDAQVYTIRAGEACIYLEPCREYLEEMGKYFPLENEREAGAAACWQVQEQ